jgi:RimJ/RimL family protein N-acetyltransferase/enterochelin esterase-like enzyme
MNYINPPRKFPENVTHKTFYSKLYGNVIGFNIYLPRDYEKNEKKYPVSYYLHGWKGNESSDIFTYEKINLKKQYIAVFPNNSPVIRSVGNLPVESMIINELIPYIDKQYRTIADSENREISGFSMGAGMAFYYSVKHPELFSSVTAYAGTYHHYYHKGSLTVGVEPEKATALYEDMMRDERDLEEGNILCWIRQNMNIIRGNLDICIHIGTTDVLFCDNEILHLYLDSLSIPHKYRKFYGVGHELDKIVLRAQENRGKPMKLKHKGTVVLETERLILRRFKMDDAEQIYHNCWSDPDVWKWSTYEPMDSMDDVFILNNIFTDFWFSKYRRLDYYDWAIQLKSSREVIGRLRGMHPDDRIYQVELAYELGQNWWNHGLMTEAVHGIIDFCIGEVGFNRVYAGHAHENPASGKVMQKCGMTYEGTARQMYKCNNGMYDLVNYAILAEDYCNRKKVLVEGLNCDHAIADGVQSMSRKSNL